MYSWGTVLPGCLIHIILDFVFQRQIPILSAVSEMFTTNLHLLIYPHDFSEILQDTEYIL